MSDRPSAADFTIERAQKRASRTVSQLRELSDMDPIIIDMALVLARAMAKEDPYVFIVETRGSSFQLTNQADQPIKLARLLERFARRARSEVQS